MSDQATTRRKTTDSRSSLMSLEAFIESAWSEHAEPTQTVADRLQASALVVGWVAQTGPYAQRVTHVFGPHPGRWGEVVALPQSLRAVPCCHSAAGAAPDRGIATLRCCDGDDAALAAQELPPGSMAHGALAVGGNNLACALEESAKRNAGQSAGMVRAAEGALALQSHARIPSDEQTWCKEDLDALARC